MYITTIAPRVSETDGVGHISNTALPVWFEAGRTQLFRLFNPADSFANWPMIVKTYTVTFDQEIIYGTDVTVECEVARIGTTSLTLAERVVQGEQVCSTCEVVYVLVGGDRRPMPIPTAIRQQLEQHLVKESHD